MDLFVIGNINSGKSSFINKLLLNNEYEVIAIDDYRKKYSDGSRLGEENAMKRFVEDICKPHSKIIEYSGLGPITKTLFEAGYKNTSIVVWLDTSVDLCISRIDGKRKEFDRIPYPYKEFPIKDVIENINCDLEKKIFKTWENKSKMIIKASKCFDVFETVNRILIVSEFIDELEPLTEVFIIKGSIPTLSATINSDIDLLVISKQLDDILSVLEKYDAKKVGNKIYFFIKGIFTELEVHIDYEALMKSHLAYNGIVSLNEYQQRYIELINKKGYKLEQKKLLEVDIEFLKEETDYFISSLQFVSHDKYKYYFHCFIVSHNIIRLMTYIEVGVAYNYLPKEVFKRIESNILDDLLGYQNRTVEEQLLLYEKYFKELV